MTCSLLGEISIAQEFKVAIDSSQPEITPEHRLEVRKKRVIDLSTKLVDKLSLYTEAFPVMNVRNHFLFKSYGHFERILGTRTSDWHHN